MKKQKILSKLAALATARFGYMATASGKVVSV